MFRVLGLRVVLATAVLVLAACTTTISVETGETTTAAPPATTEARPDSTSASPETNAPPETTAAPPPDQEGYPAYFYVVFDGVECSLRTGSDRVEAGRAIVEFLNNTEFSVSLWIWRLDDGVSYEEFQAISVSGPPDGVADTMAAIPGPGSEAGPLRHSLDFELPEGTHGLLCLQTAATGSAPDEVSHIALVEAVASPPREEAGLPRYGIAGGYGITEGGPMPVGFAGVIYDGSGCTSEGPERIDRGTFDVVDGGVFEVGLMNMTDEDVGLHVARLIDGVTYDEFRARIETGPADDIAPVVAWITTPEDHPGPASQLRSFHAEAGTYAMTCVSLEGSGPPSIIHVESSDNG